jgi:hypothetical protein
VGLRSHNGLDPLYTQVLDAAPPNPHSFRLLQTIITLKDTLSVKDLAGLFQIECADVILAMQGFQSILFVPEDDKQPIQPFHTSLRDFLTTEARSAHLFIQPSIRHLSIATDCLAVMAVHMSDTFHECDGLEFAARSWCHHLKYTVQEEGSDNIPLSRDGDVLMKLTLFISQSFDSWVNSIIVQGRIGEILDDLNTFLHHHVCHLL